MLFRSLRNKNLWLEDSTRTATDVHDLSSDFLPNFSSSQGTLSVWRVEDDRANLDLIVTGFAAAWQRLDKLDFVLLDYSAVETVTGTLANTPGDTPYRPAIPEHRDITNLTIGRILHLIDMTRRRDASFFIRKTEKQIGNLLADEIKAGRLDPTTIELKLYDGIQKYRSDI